MKPVTLVDQGSFLAGGTVVTAPGDYVGTTEPTNNAGETLHGDHAYVFIRNRRMPAIRPSSSFTATVSRQRPGKRRPTAANGFQNIFLEKRYKTYLVDEPRRGRAGRSTVAAPSVPGRMTNCGSTTSASASGLIITITSSSLRMRPHRTSFPGYDA